MLPVPNSKGHTSASKWERLKLRTLSPRAHIVPKSGNGSYATEGQVHRSETESALAFPAGGFA